jgi:hypothetical protein
MDHSKSSNFRENNFRKNNFYEGHGSYSLGQYSCYALGKSIVDSTSQPDIDDFQQSDIDDFHWLKKMVTTLNRGSLGQLLISAARKGIQRDVDLILPIAISNNMHTELNEAFCMAALNCHIAIMELLFVNGVDIHYKKDLALKRAVGSGHPESVSFLLANGADVHVNNDKLLIKCCQFGDYVDVLKLLIEKNIDVIKHYHTAYNACLNFNYSKCAAVLIQYSNSNPIDKSIPAKQIDVNDDEIDHLVEQAEFDDYQNNQSENSSNNSEDYNDS